MFESNERIPSMMWCAVLPNGYDLWSNCVVSNNAFVSSVCAMFQVWVKIETQLVVDLVSSSLEWLSS